MDVYCYPLDRFGPMNEKRGRSGYGARWSTVIAELEQEAMLLGADEVLILLALDRSQIRVDGWPKVTATVPPQVAVAFTSKHGPLRFDCDRWATWQENVRAIGLTLQRLRLIDEGGVARSGEQYRGWQAIGPGAPTSIGSALTEEQAARTLATYSDGSGDARDWQLILTDRRCVPAVFRAAAAKHHPDAGGDRATFEKITAARDLLLATAKAAG